jgi:hypothetical protein
MQRASASWLWLAGSDPHGMFDEMPHLDVWVMPSILDVPEDLTSAFETHGNLLRQLVGVERSLRKPVADQITNLVSLTLEH